MLLLYTRYIAYIYWSNYSVKGALISVELLQLL